MMFAGLAARFALTGGMKLFLGKFGKPLLIAIAIGVAVAVIDQRGFERAEQQEHTRQLERQLITQAVVRAIDGELDTKLRTISADVDGKIQTIDTQEKTIVQPTITRELLRDRTLADPSRCLSPGLLEAINAARGYLLDERLAGAGADARPGNPAAVPPGGKGH